MKIRTRLLATTLIISILPLTLVGGLSLWKSRQALSEQTFSHLQSVRQIKKSQIEGFFKERREDVLVLMHMVALLRQDAEQKLSSVQMNKIAQLEAFFQERLSNIAVLSQDEWIAQALEQFDGAFQNEGKIGGLAWKSIEGRLGQGLKKIQQEYDYFDLLLISKDANVAYSTRQGIDLGQNLNTVVPEENALRRAFNKGLEQVAIEDFVPYAAADNQAIAFISAPLYRFGELTGVLVLALSLDSHAPASVNGIVQRSEGLGETGESFLITHQQEQHVYLSALTSASTLPDRKTAKSIDVQLGLDSETGVMIKMTSDKLLKLSAYAPVKIPGLHWALVSQINLEEAITPKLGKEKLDFFSQYIVHYDYHDLVLVHPEGQIFYTVLKEDDYGTNLFEDEYSDTHLATLVKKVHNSGKLGVSDYALYEPSNNEPAAFIAQPLLSSNGDVELIVALQLHDNSMGEIMAKRTGMGEQGESYLVGSDYLMRSNAFLDPEHHSIQASLHNPDKGIVKTPSVQAALEGKTGEHISENYLGQAVLSAYTPLNIAGQRWALIVDINRHEALAEARKLQIMIAGLMLIIILFCWWFASRFTTQIVSPLLLVRNQLKSLSHGELLDTKLDYQGNNEIAEIITASKQLEHALRSIIVQANNIAAGDYNNEIKLLSEKDELGQALVDMITTLRGVVRQANLIAEGDYSSEVRVLSDADQLGLALVNMTRTLRQMHEENSSALRKLEQENAQKNRQDWFKTGISQLSERMSGQQDIATLSKNIISFLANYLQAQIGTFYIYQSNQQTHQGALKLLGSYAYTRRKNMSGEVVLGEGLVGQAALEKQLIIITAVPEDYMQIQSSVGEAVPENLVIVPFNYENQLAGVFELGRFTAFSEDELNFLQQITQPIGIAVNTAESRLQMQELLEQSRAQAEELRTQSEELQNQQEELRQNNEELQSQSEELKTQQEELLQANDELAARSHDLERQKEAIREKNKTLEKTQKSIQAKAEELELASKYKSEFLANMSHELRTPLNSMLILSQMLMENKNNNLNEQQIESAQTIHHAGADLLQLINDILDLSKVEAGKIELVPEIFAIGSLMENLQRRFQPIAENKGLSFNIHSELPPDSTLHTDIQRLSQVISNLLSNAFKFTDQGGSVTLKISPSTENLCNFAVIDTGIGISTAHQKSIFEAFQQADGTTSRRYGGTGLGLSISRQLAKLLHGKITLHSVKNEGSTFTLSIPAQITANTANTANTLSEYETPATPSPEQTQPSPANPVPVAPKPLPDSKSATPKKTQAVQVCDDDRKQLQAGDKTLLIIEDDDKFCRILVNLAHQHDFKALYALDGESGLNTAKEYLPSAIVL
ncbi:ATP-binding protein, partial [Candidatus Venteria ishoeyi]